MIRVGEQGIYLSDETVKKLSPYMLSQFKKTLVLDFSALNTTAPVYTETDPVFTAWLATPPNISIFTNDAGYLTSFSETDPIFSLWQSTYDNHADWDTAYGWGNHASAGYLTSYTETDPVFTTWLGTNPFSSYLTSATAASTYYPIPVGTTAQYIRGDGSLATFPTNVSSFTNDSAYITSSALSPYLTSATAASTYQPIGSYLTSISSSNVITALGYTPYDSANPSGYITSSSLSSYVPNTRTLTINGTTYDLSSNRSWTISTGTTYTFSTGLTDTAGTITSNLSTGISGGQSVIGGTASGNNLTLSSTSNATKGKILFGTSAYDEVNNRLGIGTSSPTQKLSVNGNAAVGLDTTYLPDGITKAGGALLVGSTSLISSLGYGTLQDNVIQLGDNISTNFYAHSPSMAFSTNQTGVDQLVGRLIGVNSSLGTLEKRVAQIGIHTDTATNNGKITLVVSNGTTFVSGITVKNSGNVGIQVDTPTAYLHIKAGTATANTAPLKLTSGTNLTTPENGAFEFDGTNLYFTVGGVRKIVTLT